MNVPRITIDASHTAGSGKNTGIERVVRNLCQQLPSITQERGLDAAQVVTHIHGHFFPVDQRQRRGLTRMSRWEANAQDFVPKWLQALPLAIADRWPKTKMRKWLRPNPSHLGGYKVPHFVYSQWVQAGRFIRGAALTPSQNDVLILSDAYWTSPEVWNTVARFRRAGALIATVVYDLIPITHPQFVGAKRSEKFRRYLEQVAIHSDLIVAISQTVRDDVARFIDEELPRGLGPACRDIRSFVLGAEIRYASGNVRPAIADLFSKADRHTPYLMVGSFDPRKNHHQAIDAFEKLWGTHPHLKLCMFGRVGSLCLDVMERIQKHPMLNRGLFVYHDANDAELQHAYQHCSGVLLPSIVEGFGLPIVESLWHRKRTFVSNTPIHREVGGDACDFFELGSPESLADAILKWESERDRPEARRADGRKMMPTTWEASANQLLDACLDAFQNRSSVPVHARAA